MSWGDRTIGIVLGIVVGIVIIVLFVFTGGSESLDSPSLDANQTLETTTPGRSP